jgi:hypothetical protein
MLFKNDRMKYDIIFKKYQNEILQEYSHEISFNYKNATQDDFKDKLIKKHFDNYKKESFEFKNDFKKRWGTPSGYTLQYYLPYTYRQEFWNGVIGVKSAKIALKIGVLNVIKHGLPKASVAIPAALKTIATYKAYIMGTPVAVWLASMFLS